jgi:basic membrane protein A
MKKRAIALALSALMITGLVGCGSKTEGEDTKTPVADAMKVGMVTDAGTIDDKSFNQGTWEGILKAESELGIESNYLKPAGTTEADYVKEIQNLYDTDYKFIVTPGFKFETAVYQAQEKYKDAKFVIIDGAPQDPQGNYVVADNTVAIYFAEHEAGFMAGVAAALELKEGELGFIGGMKIPAVQKFNWGFQQGVAYANENLGTKMSIKAENVKYEGSFDNVAGGQQLAATMFDRGVKAIFCAAGGVGVGAITEAKTRVEGGKDAWIVGVDVDQYNDGLLSNGKSVILTSAMKKVDSASYQMIKDELDGKFPGGQTLTFDSKSDGVGLPAENPNLSKETTDKAAELFEQIKSGAITVSDQQGSLIE